MQPFQTNQHIVTIRRDTDNLKNGDKVTLFCLECKTYHRIEMGKILNGVVETLVYPLPYEKP